MDLYSGGLIFGWTYIRVDLYSGGLIFGWTYIRVDLYSGGLIFEWTYIRVDLYSGGLIFGWTYIRVDLYSGGLIFGCTYICANTIFKYLTLQFHGTYLMELIYLLLFFNKILRRTSLRFSFFKDNFQNDVNFKTCRTVGRRTGRQA